MSVEELRELWAGDRVALNAWLTLDGTASAGAVSAAGFDAVTLDLQHGAAEPSAAPSIIDAIERSGATPFVRLHRNEPASIMRMLDIGARGLICPTIGSREEAERLVMWSRYPPAGTRSYGPVRSAFGAGADQVRGASDGVLVFAMIETASAAGQIDAIAGTPGLDGLYVGPADLSLGLGLGTFADLRDPALLHVLDRVVAAARRSGIVPGIHAPGVAGVAEMAERGFRFIGAAVDSDLLQIAASAALGAARSRLGLA